MKKVFFFSIVLNVLLCICLSILILRSDRFRRFVNDGDKKDISGWQPYNHWVDRSSLFNYISIDTSDIIFIGNSIIENGLWSEIFDDERIKNRGIGSDKSDGVVRRIDGILSKHPKKIFVLIGINDLCAQTGISQILGNYSLIIKKRDQISLQTDLLFISVLPTRLDYLSVDDSIIELNRGMKDLAERSNCTYIDIYSKMVDQYKQLIWAFTNDRLHLNGHGYMVMRRYLKPYFD